MVWLRSSYMVAVAVFSLAAADPATAAPEPTPSPLQLQAIQQHEFEADKGTVFSSVVDVLQDLGFTIASADLATGFITAESPQTSTKSMSDAVWWGGATSNSRVTAFIEALPNGRTRVRLNFVSRKFRLGWSYTREEHDHAVTEPRVYQVAFDKIDEAVFVRKSTAGATPTPPRQHRGLARLRPPRARRISGEALRGFAKNGKGR